MIRSQNTDHQPLMHCVCVCVCVCTCVPAHNIRELRMHACLRVEDADMPHKQTNERHAHRQACTKRRQVWHACMNYRQVLHAFVHACLHTKHAFSERMYGALDAQNRWTPDHASARVPTCLSALEVCMCSDAVLMHSISFAKCMHAKQVFRLPICSVYHQACYMKSCTFLGGQPSGAS